MSRWQVALVCHFASGPDPQDPSVMFHTGTLPGLRVMDRWVLKVWALEERKRHYERVLRQELDGMDDEFSTLKFLAQELQMRADNIRRQKQPRKTKENQFQIAA